MGRVLRFGIGSRVSGVVIWTCSTSSEEPSRVQRNLEQEFLLSFFLGHKSKVQTVGKLGNVLFISRKERHQRQIDLRRI